MESRSLNSWKEGTDCCSWDGVTCNEYTGNVVELDLSCSSLQGVIQSNSSLFQLQSLQSLNFAYNLLVGPLPSNISTLTKLMQLDISSNRLTGTIPSALFDLPSLVYLSLGYNNLTGNIGEFQSPVLERIQISHNWMEGDNFSSISKLGKLRYLDLSSNSLTGNFELDVFSNLQNLLSVNLSQNFLLSVTSRNNTAYSPLPNFLELDISYCNAKEIPFFIRNLVGISSLDLSHNNIQGMLPKWLHDTPMPIKFMLSGNSITGGIQNLPLCHGADLSFNKIRSVPTNLSGITMIDLSHNLIEKGLENLHQINADKVNLSFNELGGAIPGNLSLKWLDLSHNFFESGVQNICGFVGIYVDLRFNNLRGAIPGNVSVIQLILSHNFLDSGVEILPWIGATFVYLSFNELGGAIPSNISLNTLDLSHNSFETGVENLCWIHAEVVDLSYNKFRGEIKGNISFSSLILSHNHLTAAKNVQSTSLTILDLSFNNLQGTLPIPKTEEGMSVYSVSNNKLSGSIPPNICDLVGIWLINLSYNNFSGKVPDCLLKIPSLFMLKLRSNNLSGIIPQSTGNNLVVLDMSNNHLEGMIPRSLSNCQYIEVLVLSNNLIYDRFPSWLEGMPSLKVLMLGSNKLYGNLSSTLPLINDSSTAFENLRVIDVSNNDLYGYLPSPYFQSWKSMKKAGEQKYYSFINDHAEEYNDVPVMIINKGMEMEFRNLLTFLKAFDFSNNKFEGEIPESIGDLSSLVVLNLSGNHFSGNISSSLGKLVDLNSLDLSNNKLSGIIPATLSSLTFLSAFNVSENDLEGSIPQGGQLTTFSNDSFKGNPNLCGIPLSTKCGRPLVPNSPEEEEDKSWLDGFTWESVAIGYGCGFLLGIFIGALILMRHLEFVLGIFNIRLIWRIKRSHRMENI